MYTIYYGDYLIHTGNGASDGYTVTDAKLQLETGTAGSLTFTIAEEHPNFSELILISNKTL